MLFRKRMPRSCSYCKYGTSIGDDQILCIKKGLVPDTHKCRKFVYDPCKRIPAKAKALNFVKYQDEDFSL